LATKPRSRFQARSAFFWQCGQRYRQINFARHVISIANTWELEEALRLLEERDGGAGIVERPCVALPVFEFLGCDYLKWRRPVQPVRLRAAATRNKQFVVRSPRR
jgi:hypothetical protein